MGYLNANCFVNIAQSGQTWLLVVLFLLSTPFIAFADETGEEHSHAPVTDQHKKNVESMLELMGVPTQVDKAAANVLALYTPKTEKKNPDPNVNLVVDAYREDVKKVVNGVLSWNSLKPNYISSYSTRLTEEDVAAVNGFLISPAGQKFIKSREEATSEIELITQHLADEDIAKPLAELTNQLRDVLTKIQAAKQKNN